MKTVTVLTVTVDMTIVIADVWRLGKLVMLRRHNRVGNLAVEGTKLVLTGDASQIDNPYLDSSSNGLSYLVERLKGKGIVGHVTLAKSERSELASLVTAEL